MGQEADEILPKKYYRGDVKRVIKWFYLTLSQEGRIVASEFSSRRTKKLGFFKLLNLLSAVFLTVVLSSVAAVSAFSPDEDLTARAMLLMDARTGRILYQKGADLRLPPASTTKIVTAIVTLESGKKPKERLTVSKAATRVPASKLYLTPGQTISVEDLLYAILLSSANDASMVLAEGIGGSVDQFADLMTKKAHGVGAKNTNFSNPHGLTAPDHYSTAQDLAIIFRYAMRNPTFREIVQTKISSVKSVLPGRKREKTRLISVRNHNLLLWNFDGAIGGKTGYTYAAQKCFVGAVERNGVTLIVSILGSRNLWGDTRRLLQYGFENYDALTILTRLNGTAAPAGLSGLRSERVSAPVVTAQGREQPNGGSEGYVLQVASFREVERAESLLKMFSDRGFDAFVETAALEEGETTYRVRIGPYTEFLEAQKMAEKVLGQSGHRPLILPVQASDAMGDRGS